MVENVVYGPFQQEQLLLHLKCGAVEAQAVIAVVVLQDLVAVQVLIQ
jgi:hypothetical protein